jgi:hypothetical protein
MKETRLRRLAFLERIISKARGTQMIKIHILHNQKLGL